MAERRLRANRGNRIPIVPDAFFAIDGGGGADRPAKPLRQTLGQTLNGLDARAGVASAASVAVRLSDGTALQVVADRLGSFSSASGQEVPFEPVMLLGQLLTKSGR